MEGYCWFIYKDGVNVGNKISFFNICVKSIMEGYGIG